MIEYHEAVIEDVCAWPNLTMLGNGTILATLFNQPTHGRVPGDTDCWASTDGGRTWTKRSTAARRPTADSVRMNWAAGLGTEGDFVAVCGGWHDPGEFKRLMTPVVRISHDGGRTWDDEITFPASPKEATYVPFGDVLTGEDGALRVACYTVKPNEAYILRSADGGETWGEAVKMGGEINECGWIHLGDGRWLAAFRTVEGQYLLEYRSDDDGRTWRKGGRITEDRQHPGHLLRLRDGRILLTYGDRREGHFGVEAKLSADDGQTWGKPFRLADFDPADCGYPSSVQRADGKVVTAYYAQKSHLLDRYHMAVVIWTPAEAG